MQVRSIVFEGVKQTSLTTHDVDLRPAETGAIVKASYTCVSAGTELAKFSGLQEIEFPSYMGNRFVGRVVEIGSKCEALGVGDLVFCHAYHASYSRSTELTVKLPEALDQPIAPLLGMGLVSMTGLRTAQLELGETAVVGGAGLVGQLLAQLLQLSGVTTVLIDTLQGRLDLAAECGVEHTVNAGDDNVIGAVREIAGDGGAHAFFDCTGVPAIIHTALELVRTSGQVIFVGSPRGTHQADVSPILNAVHLWKPNGDLTFKGAHEWKLPIHASPFHRHSQQGHVNILAELITSGTLKLEPLVTSIAAPADCQGTYMALLESSETMLSAVFDWR